MIAFRQQAPKPAAARPTRVSTGSCMDAIDATGLGAAAVGGAAAAAAAAASGALPPAARLLLETPEEVAIRIACSLASPRDLLRLSTACRRFWVKILGDAGQMWAPGTTPELLSISNEAARRWLAACPAEERERVPRRWKHRHRLDCWMGLMQQALTLREPLVLNRVHSDLNLSEGGTQATRAGHPNTIMRSAASSLKMRAGKHYAKFTVVQGTYNCKTPGKKSF
jgi:hypothetical protein